MHNLSAIELHKRFISKELTAIQIVQHFLNRIQELNPTLQAFLHVFEKEALEIAKSQDARLEKGEKLGRLAGVPFGLKDNIHLKGQKSTCGSNFLSNYTAPFTATVVKNLMDEDAIPIGKCNMDEFAMGSSTENSAFFPSRNPVNESLSPGGSSGGSCAAVGGRLCPIALGTDTGGSIRQPASFTGTVGFKPTYGRNSRYGVVAFGSSFDQVGPITNYAEDAALAMEVMGKHCENDATSLPGNVGNILDGLDHPIQGKKIGVPFDAIKKPYHASFEKSLETLKEMGAELIPITLSYLHSLIPVYYILSTAEASTNLARFDGIRYGQRAKEAKTLDEVYDLSKQLGYGHEVKKRIILGTFVLSSGYQDAFYKKAQKVRTLVIREVAEIFESVDMIALPTATNPAFPLGSIQDPVTMYEQDLYTTLANLAGLPAVSVPTHMGPESLPMGLQFVGKQKDDGKVLRYAYQFEKELSS